MQQPNTLKESSAFHKLNQKMKQKRNNVVATNININNQQNLPQQQRDGSNDPYDNAANYAQRIDTGGGDYMQQAEDELLTYNNRFSPKSNGGGNKPLQKKKQAGQSQPPII